MNPELMPIGRCAEMAGLRGHELVLGVSPSDKHQRMLARYRRAVSIEAASYRVVQEIRSAVKIGAARRAADLLIVLRWLLAPKESRDNSPAKARPRRRISARRRRAIAPTAVTQESSQRGGEIVLLFDDARQRR